MDGIEFVCITIEKQTNKREKTTPERSIQFTRKKDYDYDDNNDNRNVY